MRQTLTFIVSYNLFIHYFLNGLRPRVGERTCVVFTTYNQVKGFNPGDLETGNPSFKIRIATGDLVHKVMSHWKDARADIFSKADLIFDKGIEAQKEAENSIGTLEDADRLVFVIYAARSGLEPSLEFIKKTRTDYPRAIIIVLSCTCNREMEFADVLGEINFLLFTRECGGDSSMGELVQSVLKLAHLDSVPAHT